jgi:cytochrome P450
LRELIITLIEFKDPDLPMEIRRIRALDAVEKVNARIKSTIDARRVEPREDWVSYLLGIQIDGKTIDDEQLYTLVRSLYLGGSDTTAMMLGNTMSAILSNPALKAELMAQPEKRVGAINESIRLYGVAGLAPRYAIRDVTIAGMEIPANSYVLMGLPCANRDETKISEPEKMILDRKQNRSLTFGIGAHSCIGMQLAREAIRVSVDLLLGRLSGLRLAGEADQIGGCIFRFVPEVRVKFDDILPA